MIEKGVQKKSFSSYIPEQFRGLKGLESSRSSLQNIVSLKYSRLVSKQSYGQLVPVKVALAIGKKS